MNSVIRLGVLVGSPALPVEQEQGLARGVRRGDERAREELINASLRLVALRVLAMGVPAAERDDAFQSGVLGLMAAIDRFDADRGVRLATYAWPWITAAIRSTWHDVTRREDDLPAGGPAPDADEPLDAEVRRDLGFLLAGLPTLVSEVMRLRFGFGDGNGEVCSRASVAARLGLTVSQVRTVESNTLVGLRRRLATLGHRAPGRLGADPL